MITDREYRDLILEQRKLCKLLKKENNSKNWDRFNSIANKLNGEYRPHVEFGNLIIDKNET